MKIVLRWDVASIVFGSGTLATDDDNLDVDFPLEVDDYFKDGDDIYKISGFSGGNGESVQCVLMDFSGGTESKTDERPTFRRTFVAPLVADYMAE